MNAKLLMVARSALCALALGGVATIAAQPVRADIIDATATPTIDLTGASGAMMGLAYDPSFNQYYGATGGSPGDPGQVWSSSGALLQELVPINVDARGVWYNPNTGGIQIETFCSNCNLGDPRYGLISMGLTNTGLYTGTNTRILADVSGIADAQSAGSYDPVRNVIYSRSATSNVVNVANATTGALISTINLAVPAGSVLQNSSVAYDPLQDALILLNYSTDQALVFTMTGFYLGSSFLPGLISPDTNYSLAFANGQLFVGDVGNQSWRGYEIFSDTAAIPLPGTLPLFAGGLGSLGVLRWRRKRKAQAVA